MGRVEEAIEMARARQSALNAFTFIDDEAVDKAAEVDAAIARGELVGQLAGTPLGLKDLIDQRGRVTTCGSAFFRHRADRSAPVVERLERAGAVVIGRTGLHEFAFGFSSENPHFGPVRNPWDPGTSAGGSSGGSAAAIAAGITPIGVGSDTGGSIRVPAALCGCFGLKTTYGRVPLEGVFPLVPSIDTVGPLADSIHRLEWAYRAMADDDAPPSETRRHMRIGIPRPWLDDSPMDTKVAMAFEQAMSRIREMGHRVESVAMPGVSPPGRIWSAIAEEVTAVHAGFRAAGQPYGEDVAARLDDAEAVGPEETALAREWQADLRDRFQQVFRDYDFLATPTVPVMKKEIGNDTINGKHYRSVLSWFTALVNQSLHPAMALPILNSGLPPVSLQLIGPLNSEPVLLEFGRSLEEDSLVGFRRAPESLV